TPGECGVNLRLDDARQARSKTQLRRIAQLEIIEEHRPRVVGPVAYEEPGLEADESDRRLRADGVSRRGAGVAVEARGHIECEDRDTGCVDGADDRGEVLAHRALEPRAKKRVDDHITRRKLLSGEGFDRAPTRAEILVGVLRIAAQLLRLRRGEYR